MNIYGKNGRIRGELVVRRLIGEDLLSFSEDELTEKDGRNEIGSLAFGDGIFTDPDFSGVLSKAMEDYLFLFYFTEENPALKIPLSAVNPALSRFTGGHALSGMRLLRLFSGGTLALSVDDGNAVLSADPGFLQADGNLPGILRELVRTVFRFSGDEDELRTVRVVPKENAGRTESIPEVPVRDDVRETLLKLHRMMDELDRNRERTGQDDARFRIEYREGRSRIFGKYRLDIPDGFTLREHADGRDFVLYYPNPENPEEWEASAFVLMPEAYLPGGTAEAGLREASIDSACWFAKDVAVTGGVMRFRLYVAAVSPGNRANASHAAEALFAGIGAV